MDRPHSPPPDTQSRDPLQPRSPSPTPTPQQHERELQQHQQQHDQQYHHQHTQLSHHQHQQHYQHTYQDYPRPDSRLSDSRLLPPPSSIPARHSPSGEEPTQPASPPHKRFKHENSLPPPYPCHVDQRWVRVRPSLLIAFCC
ncbi:hypothetical protein BV20DRAFT_963706 [Pilatotrama ljubarskyi]|nr:hypothetical protein BV20DRAFT_963706 [Pilatotrama ljubarskyi]